MTLKGLDIQEDCIKAIYNESLIFDRTYALLFKDSLW